MGSLTAQDALTQDEPQSRRMWIPPVWLLVVVAISLVGAVLFLQVWLPWQTRLGVILEIERLRNTGYRWEKRGPDWIREWIGHPYHGIARNPGIGPLDVVTAVHSERIGPRTSAFLRSLLTEFTAFPTLSELELNHVAITDDWMPDVSALESLKILAVRHCRISGRGFGRLQRLRQLEELTLTYCPIRDQYLAHLTKLPALRLVNLAYCSHLTADGVEAFVKARPDCAVYLLGLNEVQRELKARGYAVSDRGMLGPYTP